MKNRLNNLLEARLYNPLLLWNGLNSISSDYKKKIKEFDIIENLYKSALKQTSTRNLVMGLEVDYSNEDCGIGGFYNAGFVPEFFSSMNLRKEKVEKDFEFYWPRDLRSGKYMKYLAGINLGIWPYIFHELTKIKIDEWNKLSFYAGREVNEFRGYFADKSDLWLHLFASEQNDFETCIPDCHVRMVSNYLKKNLEEKDKEKYFTINEEKELVKKWQETKTCDTEINGSAKYFKNIRPRFYWDGPGYTPDKETGIFKYHEGDCQVYGKPKSQQEPKRYLSPENYFSRGLTPMFSFNDDHHDMTHQFYADASVMDSISHKRMYCKLDSSCT